MTDLYLKDFSSFELTIWSNPSKDNCLIIFMSAQKYFW